MEYLIGILLAVAVCIGASATGRDRKRSFYPVVLIVTAMFYALFAVMAGSIQALLSECLPIALFLIAAGAGLKKKLWWIVAGLCAHALFDVVHHDLIPNPGVPIWWPDFCLSFDITAAAYLTLVLKRIKLVSNT